jgi:hypothetical protein
MSFKIALQFPMCFHRCQPINRFSSGRGIQVRPSRIAYRFHDTSPSFRKRQTSTQQTSGSGLPEKRKISGGGM